VIRISKEEEVVAYNLANYNVILGSNNSERIDGTESLTRGDYIKAGDGADRVYAHAGNDVAHGGWGNDYIHAGAGNDQIYGDAGNDYLWGNAGADTFHFTVNNGNDNVYGFNPSDGDRFLLYGIDPAAVSLESTIFGTELHLDGDKDTVLFVGVGANAVVQGFAGFQPLAAYDWGGVMI
jgi:Ca2+-binding RTX toxin-like protein